MAYLRLFRNNLNNKIMEKSILERINVIIESENLNINSFSRLVNVPRTTIKSMFEKGTNPSFEQIQKITDAFPSINIEWLLKGTGNMNKEKFAIVNYETKGSPYYNVDFIGGFEIMINDQTINPDYYIDFEPYNKPGVVWCNITGHSMEPAITHGDIIAMQEVKSWREFILLDEVYGLVTEEFRTVKRVSKSDKDGYYTLIPVNGNYKPQEIPKSIIQRVYKVLGSVKRF